MDKKKKQKTNENEKKSEKETATVGKEKQKSKRDTEEHKSEFIPVISTKAKDDKNKEGKTQLPISLLKDAEIEPEIEKDYFGYVAIRRKEGNEEATYYIRPANFQKYVLDKNINLDDAQRIRSEVQSHLQDLKRAWVKFGTAVLSVHVPRLYLVWGYKTFEEYCERELKLHFSTVYHIITSTLFLMKDKAALYQSLMEGRKEAYETLPSYQSLYLLAKKRRPLEKKGKFTQLLELLLKEGISTRDLQKKVKEVIGEKKKKLSLKAVVRHYEAVCEEMQKLDIAKEVIKEAEAVLERLRKIKA